MSFLIGRYEYTLDDKNRLGVPPKFRDALLKENGTQLYLSCGLDACLYLFLPSQFEKLTENDLAKFSMGNKEKERAFQRGFFSNTDSVELDSAGRILVPPYMRKHAALGGTVLVQGMGNRGEIWNPEKWNSYNKSKVAPTYPVAAKNLSL